MTDQIEIYTEKLQSLIEVMVDKNLDAFILCHDDEYLSSNLTDDCQRIAYLTGFTGSAGYVCVINPNSPNLKEETSAIKNRISENEVEVKNLAAIFVDGRYKVQVKEQVELDLFDTFNFKEVTITDYLKHFLDKGAIVGTDTNCINYKTFNDFEEDLLSESIEMSRLNGNLIDLIWHNRPKSNLSKITIYPDEYNGMPSLKKRENLAASLREKGLDATIILQPERICWLLNIRGNDKKSLPVINCKLVAYANETLEWYVDEEHIDEEIVGDLDAHFGHINIFDESKFDEVLERLSISKATVYLDPSSTNAHIMGILAKGSANIVTGLDLCALPQACKNNIEIAGEHKAHIKDGVAMCRFLAWLDNLTDLENIPDAETLQRKVSDIDEGVLAKHAESYRRVEGDYLESSFDTISALGPNAAMCHYNHEDVTTPRVLGYDPIYLIDSGAHYIEGTTDITRTIKVGLDVPAEIKQMYTTVLKCHIALTTTIFPRGTSGIQLDAIARRPLWDLGLDYDHGTGHGVGHVLNVHEGPQVISAKQSTIPLEEGMVVSIEPGFYKDNDYGIRLENLVVVEECNIANFSHMLCFSPLTLVPFDTRLIIREMLTSKEREWLNNYHQRVLTLIKTAGTTLSDLEISWLTKATESI